ncbi:putative phosphotransferase enzyme family protein [Botrytis fragariae]|uniref:Putative phosphotransferase enzyme family protein n=1 Tax=Botrytis fragariae TaxID=1964551 RepID=A0A8H6EE78_9HELO|nr:putative phosphotransferase enzyme family protein [Botrytis fragariae]KAF5869042.1 putative phosphotransferase enzyme family protein [Botrytis fragariae]
MLWHHIGRRYVCRPLSMPVAIRNLSILPTSSRTLRLIPFKHRCVSTHTDSQNYDHFFRYTRGKWLQDGEKRFFERYQEFNVEALKGIAIESVGAKSCSSMTKISESGRHRVFKLIVDNDSVAIARITLRNLCPDSKATASRWQLWISTILKIPVPKVYAWNAESNNPVATDYIIMEEAPEISLVDRNRESYKEVVIREELVTELGSRQKFVADIVAIEKKLLFVVLKRHGSIYFTGDWFSGCEKAEVMNDIPIEVKKEVEERFVIRPRVENTSREDELSALRINHGPWKTAHEFLKSQANNWIKWLGQSNLAESPKKEAIFDSQHSPNFWPSIALLFQKMQGWLSLIFGIPILIQSMFLSKMTISLTSLIDWQFAWTGPLFLQFDDPIFTKYNRAMQLANFEESSPIAHDGRRIRRIDWGFFRKDVYESENADQSPILNKMKNVPAAGVRKEILDDDFDTWNGDIKLGKNGIQHSCPIRFTKEEVQNHIQEVMMWRDVYDF